MEHFYQTVGEDWMDFQELYTIDKKEGYKIIIKDEKRKLKPSELLKADKVSNPISQSYIDNKIKSIKHSNDSYMQK